MSFRTFYYKDLNDFFGKRRIYISSDNFQFEADEDNRFYREYLEWLEEGNTPLPADEVGSEPTAEEPTE